MVAKSMTLGERILHRLGFHDKWEKYGNYKDDGRNIGEVLRCSTCGWLKVWKTPKKIIWE